MEFGSSSRGERRISNPLLPLNQNESLQTMQDLYTAITPAYQLETDNSSAGEHEESSKSGEDSIAKEPVINIAGCRDDNFILKRCVFLIGQTGERMSKGIFNLDVASEVGIIVDNVQVSLSLRQ